MKDLQLIEAKSGKVDFIIHGASDDTGLMLLQRLYVLLFTLRPGYYGEAAASLTLLSFLIGANFPGDEAMSSVLSLTCAMAQNQLDEEDKQHIESFTGECKNGVLICTLTLKDGTTIRGELTNG